MGADFTYALIPDCELTEERLAWLSKQCTSLPDDEEKFCEEFECDFTKQHLIQAIEDAEDFGNRRDVAHLYPTKDIVYLISGGLSWGDDPTEAYSTMNILNHMFGTTFEEWALEDIGEKPYTVLLLYPDYIADDYGKTFMGYVNAESKEIAISKARNDAIRINDLELDSPLDLKVVAIIEGHHKDINDGTL